MLIGDFVLRRDGHPVQLHDTDVAVDGEAVVLEQDLAPPLQLLPRDELPVATRRRPF